MQRFRRLMAILNIDILKCYLVFERPSGHLRCGLDLFGDVCVFAENVFVQDGNVKCH
jgi:hypothetical protein